MPDGRADTDCCEGTAGYSPPMRLFALALTMLALSACGAPEPASICRPAGTGSGKLEFGGFEVTGRIERVRVTQETGTGVPQILLDFDETGTKLFARMTEDRIGEFMPITVDGEVLSSPRIQEKIPNGQVAISGGFTLEEATEIARRIAPPCT